MIEIVIYVLIVFLMIQKKTTDHSLNDKLSKKIEWLKIII